MQMAQVTGVLSGNPARVNVIWKMVSSRAYTKELLVVRKLQAPSHTGPSES